MAKCAHGCVRAPGANNRLTSAEYSGGALCNLAIEVASEAALETRDRILLGTDPSELVMAAAMLATFSAGATLVFATSRGSLEYVENLSDECDRHQISVLMLSAADFQAWAAHLKRPGASRPGSLRSVVVFGDIRSGADSLAAWRSAGLQDLPVIVFWSPSDWILPAVVRTWSSGVAAPDSFLGRTLSNSLACAMDSSHLIPEGIPGELVIGGACIPQKINPPPADCVLEGDPFGGTAGESIVRTGLQMIRNADGIRLAEDSDEVSEPETASFEPSRPEETAAEADIAMPDDAYESREETTFGETASPSEPAPAKAGGWRRWMDKLSGKG